LASVNHQMAVFRFVAGSLHQTLILFQPLCSKNTGVGLNKTRQAAHFTARLEKVGS
jgi:hypothetical protein